jgi:transcriptional regulator of acetoin/glycerol metabolism
VACRIGVSLDTASGGAVIGSFQEPTTQADEQAHLLKLHSAKEHTIAGLAELFEVSRPTVYRVLERHRAPDLPTPMTPTGAEAAAG